MCCMQTELLFNATSDHCSCSVETPRDHNICIFICPFINTCEDAGVIHVRPSASSHEHLQSVFSPSLSCMTVFCSSIPDHDDHRLFNTHSMLYICKGWRFDPDSIHTGTKPITFHPHLVACVSFNPFSATVLETLENKRCISIV